MVENEVSNPNMIVSPSDTLLSPKLNVQYVDILPDIDSFSNLWFKGSGPEFPCLFANGYSYSCMPINTKTCRNIRFHTLNDKRPRILVTNSKRNIKNIYFSLPYYVRVCDTTKIV